MKTAINQVHALLKKIRLEAMLVSCPENISYLTGYLSRDSWLLICPKKNFYLTDSRYTQEAKDHLSKDFSLQQIRGTLPDSLALLVKQLQISCLGFEERRVSFSQYQKLKQAIGDKIKLLPTSGLIENLRQIKNREEATLIKKATQIAVEALKFAQSIIASGMKEIELAGEVERFIRYNGGTGTSFDIIVACGPNSSYPHHKTSYRKIQNNEPVLLDIGVEYLGFKSDLTRVFFLGKISPLAQKIYSLVLKAQENAIKIIKPGVSISEVDAAARKYITNKGYGRYFGHNLGHGVGLEIHEAPSISSQQKGKLKPGMIFTVEPAVYLPGKFGIRIEDMVLVTKKGVELLSGTLNK